MCKGVAGVKGGSFKRSQRDFLLSLFNNNGGPKIRERDTHIRMADTFKDKDETTVNRVIEKGFTELSQSIDIQDNEEGGHDQNEGVVEVGDPPPPPPPPPPSPL